MVLIGCSHDGGISAVNPVGHTGLNAQMHSLASLVCSTPLRIDICATSTHLWLCRDATLRFLSVSRIYNSIMRKDKTGSCSLRATMVSGMVLLTRSCSAIQLRSKALTSDLLPGLASRSRRLASARIHLRSSQSCY